MTVNQKLTYAKVRLLMRHKFFGCFLFNFPFEKRTGMKMPTMATDGKKIYYEEKFIDLLDKDEVMTTVLHEIMHNTFKHFFRFTPKQFNDPENGDLLNLALDYAINGIIINEMAPKDNLLKFPKGILYDEQFKGWNAEKIFAFLLKEKKDNPQKSKNRTQGGKGKGDGSGQFDDHGTSSKETEEGVQKETKASGKTREDQMNDIDRKMFRTASGMSAKERGEIPGDFIRLIDDFLENLRGHIDWRRYIKSKLQDLGKEQYSTLRFNKRFLRSGFYLPGTIGTRAKVALALDTSGSIGHDDIVEFLQNVASMLNRMPGLEILMYGVDAEIQGKARIRGRKGFRTNLEKVLKGGGGTSFIPVWKDLLAGGDKDIKCLFYFSDMYSDQMQIEKAVGTKGNWRTFWVMKPESAEIEIPFGERIIMWPD